MSKTTAFAVATVILCWAAPALAGLVITQEQTMSSGERTRTSQQTIMVQGNKQKIVDERRTVVIDLDKGKQLVLMPATKTYFETAFVPRRRMGTMMGPARAGALDFKKTGKTRTVAGYKCDEYEATGQSMSGEYTTTQCFSKSVPGAAEFTTFQNTMLEKLKGATPETKGLPKDAVPLASDSTIKIGRHMRPRTEGGQGGGAGGARPERPPIVIHTVVTKIEKQDLPPSTFEVPADYKLGSMMQPGLGAGAAPGSPAAAPSAATKPSGN
jgi:hypothetical protein